MYRSVNIYVYMFVMQREFVQLVIDGVEKLISYDKALEEGKSIDAMIPKLD